MAFLLGAGCGPGGRHDSVGVAFGAASTAELTLSWTNNASDADGIYVQRAPGVDGPMATIATLDATSSSYVDTEVQAGVEACYRVGAFNSAGAQGGQFRCSDDVWCD